MRTYVVGDIHGQHAALVACLQEGGFDYQQDRLVVLGDVCDRGSRVKEAVGELLSIRDCVYVLGNHDVMALEWVRRDLCEDRWLQQGGQMTLASYGGRKMPRAQQDFFGRGRWYFEDAGRLFVHAGFDPGIPLDQQPADRLIWDRSLVEGAWQAHQTGQAWGVPGYAEVFVGHTPTLLFGSPEPLHWGNLWLLDTGAGYGRYLTLMEVETKRFWQAACAE